MANPILQVENLKKHFPITGGILGKKIDEMKAVDGISFSVNAGETLGIVGESGCGKSTTGRMLLRLIEPTSGNIVFEDQDLLALSNNDMRKARRNIQMVFQDPFASLNPRHTVEKVLEEPLIVHGIGGPRERRKKVREMLEVVGLSSKHAKRYPHQFSGGQRQRIGIARALMTNPKLIIADEPVSALDVSIQAQVLNLLKDLQKDFNLTYIFISHDLGVVRHMSDRVGVMYKGRMVEFAESEVIYQDPMHPYTQQLLSAVPIPDPAYYKDGAKYETVFDGLPDKYTIEDNWMNVTEELPGLVEVEPEHFVSCHVDFEMGQERIELAKECTSS